MLYWYRNLLIGESLWEKTISHWEKMVYSIRSLKNGTGSVLIGASLVLLAMATPTTQPTKPQQLVLKRLTHYSTSYWYSRHRWKERKRFSSPNNANASLEKKEEQPATEATTPAATPADSAPQTGQDRSSEPTTSTTTETKAEEPIEDNYFRIHVKKLPEENKDSQGLWTWDDVEKPSENWPNGALSFKDAKKRWLRLLPRCQIKGRTSQKN